ncbi:hypothetical protein [uncultured Bradyrhizobium sp.]|jgi:hypothetical protein|uniref:hypothetical protein n=1 Tax=uncultured Bradyrhizobium sp. TaxID=199684 RepID=UPI00261E2021|nr:hypothetical protein [uncultured Bradyrhizobium sp.]
MYRYVARANVDHYLGLLQIDDILPHNRSVITKLLVEEEDKLGHDLERLEFAETRAAASRDRMNRQRNLRDSFIDGSSERAQADRLLVNLEALHQLLDGFCHQMRHRVNACSL